MAKYAKSAALNVATLPESQVGEASYEARIAALAYELWLERGCPIGSDQEDWFRAEAALKRASRNTRTEAEMMVEIRCWGHWEVWEMEWGGARWVWD